MRILKEYQDLQLRERYGRAYIHFVLQTPEGISCEIPVDGATAKRMMENPELMRTPVQEACAKLTVADFRKMGIMEYLRYERRFSEDKAEKSYQSIVKHSDIINEFYRFLMDGAYPQVPLNEQGYTAADIVRDLDYSVFGAYKFLALLRETPEKAMAAYQERARTVQSNAGKPVAQPAATIVPPPVAMAPANEETLEKLDALQQAVTALQRSFDEKIAEDTYKNQLFDNMHRELVRYQNGAMEKVVDTIAMDLIQLIDSTKGHIRVYEQKEVDADSYKRLLRIVKGVVEDLQDILYRQSIEAYEVAGDAVDVRRQKIVQTVPTDDPARNNCVAERLAEGYEKDGKVLRPERIKIYKAVIPDGGNATQG